MMQPNCGFYKECTPGKAGEPLFWSANRWHLCGQSPHGKRWSFHISGEHWLNYVAWGRVEGVPRIWFERVQRPVNYSPM